MNTVTIRDNRRSAHQPHARLADCKIAAGPGARYVEIEDPRNNTLLCAGYAREDNDATRIGTIPEHARLLWMDWDGNEDTPLRLTETRPIYGEFAILIADRNPGPIETDEWGFTDEPEDDRHTEMSANDTITIETTITVLYQQMYKSLAQWLIQHDIMEYQTNRILGEILEYNDILDLFNGDIDIQQIINEHDDLKHYSDYQCPCCGGNVGFTGMYDDSMDAMCLDCHEEYELDDLVPARR